MDFYEAAVKCRKDVLKPNIRCEVKAINPTSQLAKELMKRLEKLKEQHDEENVRKNLELSQNTKTLEKLNLDKATLINKRDSIRSKNDKLKQEVIKETEKQCSLGSNSSRQNQDEVKHMKAKIIKLKKLISERNQVLLRSKDQELENAKQIAKLRILLKNSIMVIYSNQFLLYNLNIGT